MKIFTDKLAKKRIKKAQKEFELLRKPTTPFSKLEIVENFIKSSKSSKE